MVGGWGVEVVATTCRQDAKAIEGLTAEWGGQTYHVRHLVSANRQGEPVRSVEPDEATLPAAASTRNSQSFLANPKPLTKGRTKSNMAHATCFLRRATEAVGGRLGITLWGTARGSYTFKY